MFNSLFRERRRSVAVRGLDGANVGAEFAFERFVDAAASAFIAPIAALSLIHDDDQIVKASHGMPGGRLPRAHGFCGFTLDSGGVLECCDPECDARFAGLPSVSGDPHVRYYIGAPLRLLSGIDVGALCVLDMVPRHPASGDQKAYLLGLARQASMALENSLTLRGRAA